MKVFKKILLNKKSICKKTLRYWSIVFSMLGIISLFWDTTQMMVNNLVPSCILITGIIVLIPIISILQTIHASEKIIFSNVYLKHLSVTYGDLFENKNNIIVIPVNRCFDMTLENGLISPKTIHGKFIQKYKDNYDLNSLVQGELDKNTTLQPITNPNKTIGNLSQFPAGTVLSIELEQITYYLLAITEFDKNATAHCSIDDYCISIFKLIEYFGNFGNGNSLAMPIIGSGFARLGKTPIEVLNIIISLTKAKQTCMMGNIKIVIHHTLKDTLAIQDI